MLHRRSRLASAVSRILELESKRETTWYSQPSSTRIWSSRVNEACETFVAIARGSRLCSNLKRKLNMKGFNNAIYEIFTQLVGSRSRVLDIFQGNFGPFLLWKVFGVGAKDLWVACACSKGAKFLGVGKETANR